MVQLLGQGVVHLASESILINDEGTISLRQPYVLDASRPCCTMICKIEENGVTIVSDEVRQLLVAREPTLPFRSVRFENEASPPDECEAPADSRVMSARERASRARASAFPVNRSNRSLVRPVWERWARAVVPRSAQPPATETMA